MKTLQFKSLSRIPSPLSPLFLLSAMVIALLGNGCRNNSLTDGGSVETTNGIAGVIKDSNGKALANADVLLLEANHNPFQFAKTHLTLSAMQRTTDTAGRFKFEKLAAGTYNIQCSHPAEGANLLLKGLAVTASKGVDPLEGILIAPGKIRVSLLKSGAMAEDYIYLPGTTHYRKLYAIDIEKGEVTLEGIPAALYSKIILMKKGESESKNLIAAPISVFSHTEAIVGDFSPWSEKFKVFLNTTKTGANITENLTHFPLLIRLDQLQLQSKSLPIFETSQDSGQDLRFTKADGITSLPFEIEQWDKTNGKAAIWVKMDTLLANSHEQYILLFTGNREAKSLSQGAQVFDANTGFTGVWHLGDNAATPSILDARGINSGTLKANRTALNTASSSNIAGIIGRGLNFNGINQWVDLGKNRTFVNGFGAVTLSTWVKFGDFMGTRNILAFSQGPEFAKTYSLAQLQLKENKFLEVGGRSTSIDGYLITPDTIPINLLTWYHVTGVINYQKDSLYLYINGELKSAVYDNFQEPVSDPTPEGYSAMGSEEDGAGAFLNGVLDETHVAKVARSPDWIRMSYESQKLNSTVVELRR